MMPRGPALERVRQAFEHRGEKLKATPRGFLARCPAHDDGSPSLNVDQGERGVLLQCRSAGCSAEAITHALGLQRHELFDDERAPAKPREEKTRKDRVGWGSLELVADWLRQKHANAQVEVFTYHDDNGTPAFAVARIDFADSKKTFVQFTREGGRWVTGGLPKGLPMFRLPQLLATQAHDPVLLVEGERTAQLLAGMGFVAVTSAQGARSASKTDWSPLRGRHIVALPDADEPGRAYVEEVQRLAKEAGAALFKVVELDGLAKGEDVVDWAVRRDVDKAKELLAKLLDDALHQEVEPDASTAGPAWSAMSWDELLAMPPMSWLVDGLLPRSGVAVLASEPGAGKSFVALDLALRVATGQTTWLGADVLEHGAVAYIALEGHQGLGQRARAWQKAHPATGDARLELVTWSDDGALLRRASTFTDELRRCRDRHGRLALVVIDTMTLAIDGDENNAETISPALRQLIAAAKELDCCILVLHHIRKAAPGGRPSRMSLGDVRGSGAFVGNTDAVLALERRPGREERALHVLKAKDGAERPTTWFALHSVDLGLDANGRALSSCVAVPADAPSDEEVDREELKAQRHMQRLQERRPAITQKLVEKVQDTPGLNRTALRMACGFKHADVQVVLGELLAQGVLVEKTKSIYLGSVPGTFPDIPGTATRDGTGTRNDPVPEPGGVGEGERGNGAALGGEA